MSDRTYRSRGILLAAILTVAGILLGTLCLRYALLQALPATSPTILRLVAHDPDVVLDNATAALIPHHGMLDPDTLDAVRRAALAAPMDARPYLILGHQQLLDDRAQSALATLEAGQRLDPRQRIIHLLLLDRYLRTGRFADAAMQFSILARLVGRTQAPVTTAMAQMSLAPETREAARRALRTDPQLERSVLTALARSDTAPAAIFAMASPTAQRDASGEDSWGPILVARLIEHGHYGEARSIWKRLYHLPDAQVSAPVYDAGLRKLPGSPPFNWTLVTGSLGGVDMRNNLLAVDYYGRDSGELASQLLVLGPRTYQFGFTVEGSKTSAGPTLSWLLRCASGDKAELMRVAATGTGVRHRIVASFVVPAGCPAQQLVLLGEAGEFPTPMSVTLRDLDMRPASGTR